MMNRKRMLLSAAVLLALGTVPAEAQGLGGLLKKVKKGVEAVTGTTAKEAPAATPSAPAAARVQAVPVEGGGTITNPIPQVADVQLVGAYGKATSANYGEVRLVFRVKMLENYNEIKFGCNSNYLALMVDQDGNTYTPHETAGWYGYPVTEGVYMKIPLKDIDTFINVRQTATTIQQLQIGISASYEKTGLIILRDVPIQWGVEP